MTWLEGESWGPEISDLGAAVHIQPAFPTAFFQGLSGLTKDLFLLKIWVNIWYVYKCLYKLQYKSEAGSRSNLLSLFIWFLGL